MLRLTVLCLILSVVWGLPSPKKHSKISSFSLKGSRIINGQDAVQGQFPWQVLLYISDDDNNWICGGVILSPEWVLTAGHCARGATSGIIFAGSIDLLDGTTSLSTNFTTHEGFDGETLQDDIGLVHLDFPFRFDANIGSIALADEPVDEGTKITTSGWGVTDVVNSTLSDTLKYTDLVTISNDACNEIYNVILDGMLCATSDTDQVTSPCSGDSGGPAVINADSDPVLVAIDSFVGERGCDSGTPSGFTRVAYYRDWIRDKTGL